MHAELIAWLESERDFDDGAALYVKYGTSAIIKRLLAGGSTSYSRGVLERELTALAGRGHGADIDVRRGDIDVRAMSAPTVPAPVLAQLQAQRRPLFAQRDYLRAQLRLLRTDEERLQAALQILDLAEQITASYDAERHYRAHGTLPVAPEPAAELSQLTDSRDILRALHNARSRRSKLRNQPDKAEQLAQVQADIHLLESKLTS